LLKANGISLEANRDRSHIPRAVLVLTPKTFGFPFGQKDNEPIVVTKEAEVGNAPLASPFPRPLRQTRLIAREHLLVERLWVRTRFHLAYKVVAVALGYERH
jgi:hypothetical protein